MSRKLEYGEKDIRKIVDYFEGYIKGHSRDRVRPRERSTGGLALRYTTRSGLRSKILQFQTAMRVHEEKLDRDRPSAADRRLVHQQSEAKGAARGPPPAASPPSPVKKHISHRLKVCEGAVQSKLPLFDRK